MIKHLFIFLIIIFIIGCSDKEPTYEWFESSYTNLQNYKRVFLEGDDKSANLYLKQIEKEFQKSLDVKEYQKIILFQLALNLTALNDVEELKNRYKELRAYQKVDEFDNYFMFLNGDFANIDKSKLDKKYKNILDKFINHEIIEEKYILKIDDDLSKLIVISLNYRVNSKKELLNLGVQIASKNGYRKVLIKYLEILKNIELLKIFSK